MKKTENLNSRLGVKAKTPPKMFIPAGFPVPEGQPKRGRATPAMAEPGIKASSNSQTKPKVFLKPELKVKAKEKSPLKIRTQPKMQKSPPRSARYKAKPAPSKKVRKSKNKSLLASMFSLPWPIGLMLIAGLLLGLNFAYQILYKPTEIVGLFDSRFHKMPFETWRSYREIFKSKSTSVMTPDLLAALAQMESNGNPIVRTYWKWRWNSDVTKIFAPASTAVGMFQITQGTFNEAKHFCVHEGVAYQDLPGGVKCLGNFTYSRLVPAHAIEMTSARLHLVAEQLIHRSKRRSNWSLQNKQDIAIITHLCGAGKAERLVRSGMRMTEMGKCGDHDPLTYLHQIHRLQAQFRSLEINQAQLASIGEDGAHPEP